MGNGSWVIGNGRILCFGFSLFDAFLISAIVGNREYELVQKLSIFL